MESDNDFFWRPLPTPRGWGLRRRLWREVERHVGRARRVRMSAVFNRRFYPMTAFNSVLGLAARTMPPTYESLYSGEWTHPTGARA